jgi:hypothetical protein
MNLLFSINSSNYKPISFRERYFYDFYDIVDSFLATKLDSEDKNRLLKPMLASGGQINWYGKYEGDFKRLNDCNPIISEKVKFEFNTFIEKTDELSSSLKNKRDADNTEWGNLIANLFQHDRIILIANDHSDWGILWGWDFMSNNENKLPKLEPTFKPKPKDEEEQADEDPIVSDDDDKIKDVKTNQPIVTTTTVDPTPNPEDIIEDEVEEDEKEDDEPVGAEPKAIYVERVGCLGRIKRLLRWISYRFWALFWLILYTLLIIWLCRYCDRPNCDAYCEKLKKTKEELKDLEQRVRERCDTTYVKPH